MGWTPTQPKHAGQVGAKPVSQLQRWVRWDNPKFKTNLGNLVRPCFETKVCEGWGCSPVWAGMYEAQALVPSGNGSLSRECMTCGTAGFPYTLHYEQCLGKASPYSSVYLSGLQLEVAFQRREMNRHKDWDFHNWQESLPGTPACHLCTWKQHVSEVNTNVSLLVLWLSVKLDFKARWGKQILGDPRK